MMAYGEYETIHDLLDAYHAGERPLLGFDWHALERGVGMGDQLALTPEEIRAAMMTPERILFSRKYQAVLLEAGRCTLSVWLNKFRRPYVKTILWTSAVDWADSYASGVEIEGRAARAEMGLKW